MPAICFLLDSPRKSKPESLNHDARKSLDRAGRSRLANDPVDVMKVLLVDKGADVNAVNDLGMTPMHTAVKPGFFKSWRSAKRRSVMDF
jgi:ankyrin repeat protein